MAQKFPYASAQNAIVQIIQHLRRSFPNKIDAGVLKRLGIAPNNESYIINILKFLKIIDDEGNKNADAHSVFVIADDDNFSEEFSNFVKNSYEDLFSLHSDASWELDRPSLQTFFRQSDGTSGIVGDRQTSTFITLAEIAKKRAAGSKSASPKAANGNREQRRSTNTPKKRAPEPEVAPKKDNLERPHQHSPLIAEVGVSVKIEIILPSNGTEEVYDSIFRSIRKNIMSNGQPQRSSFIS